MDLLLQVGQIDDRSRSSLWKRGRVGRKPCRLAGGEKKRHADAREYSCRRHRAAAIAQTHHFTTRFVTAARSNAAPYSSAAAWSLNAAMLHPMGVANRSGAWT